MILVTGASDGIGLACAHAALERTDATVLITGRSPHRLERARSGVPAAARQRLQTMVCDQARRDDVEALVACVRGANAIEGAVLGVGVNPLYTEGPCRLDRLSAATIETTIATNCTHALLLTAALLERFRRQRSGALVWIGSRGAMAGLRGAGLYSATKFFLAGLARTAAHEYGGHGVRVHLAHPGLVRTPRTAAVADAFAARHHLTVADPGDVARKIIDLLLHGDPGAVEVEL